MEIKNFNVYMVGVFLDYINTVVQNEDGSYTDLDFDKYVLYLRTVDRSDPKKLDSLENLFTISISELREDKKVYKSLVKKINKIIDLNHLIAIDISIDVNTLYEFLNKELNEETSEEVMIEEVSE